MQDERERQDEERHARDSEGVLIERVLSVRKLGYAR